MAVGARNFEAAQVAVFGRQTVFSVVEQHPDATFFQPVFAEKRPGNGEFGCLIGVCERPRGKTFAHVGFVARMNIFDVADVAGDDHARIRDAVQGPALLVAHGCALAGCAVAPRRDLGVIKSDFGVIEIFAPVGG